MRRLVVVNGHPDPRRERFCAALAQAYVRGGRAAGWQASTLRVGDLALSALAEAPDDAAQTMRDEIERADRLAIVFPLWFEKPPEPLTALFAQTTPRKAHLVVTMEMPAFAYRSMVREAEVTPMFAVPNIIAEEPALIGCVSSISLEHRRAWLRTVRGYGERTSLGSRPSPSRVQAWIDRTVELFA